MVPAKDPVAHFLEAGDLAMLRKSPLAFARAPAFAKSEHSYALQWWNIVTCVPCLAPKATFNTEEHFSTVSLEVREDCVRATFPSNMCCSVALHERDVPLDCVANVTVTANSHLEKFGLKQVNVWTFDCTARTGPAVSASWVADPEQARTAILKAVQLYKQATGRVNMSQIDVNHKGAMVEVPNAQSSGGGDAGSAGSLSAGSRSIIGAGPPGTAAGPCNG